MSAVLFAGLTTIDLAYLVDDYPVEDTKTQASDQFLGAGGPAANAAVTYAFLSGSRPTLVTALGSHQLTEIARADLTEHGVRPVDVIAGEQQQLPISSIVVARRARTRTLVSLDGSRISAPAAGSTVFTDDLRIVLVDGHHEALCLEAARQARSRGITVMLDAGRWKDVHAELLPLVDVAICSAAFRPPGVPDDPADVLNYLADAGVSAAAVSAGEAPIRCRWGDDTCAVPVGREQVIDTLGAGDILHGAFCYYFGDLGQPFPEALSNAARVATFSCRYFGTREWMRHWPDARP